MKILIALIFAVLLPTQLTWAESIADLDIRLSCPIKGIYLDRTPVAGTASETLSIKNRKVPSKTSGYSITELVFKITSNKNTYDGHILARGRELVIVGYGHLFKDEFFETTMNLTYHIDIDNLNFKRTLTFFSRSSRAVRTDSSTKGVCKKL